ncbi:MAG: TylF/MycF/NovP-related O-methyltransferase [Candidatus Acidiferrales bacterium]
MRSRTFRDIPRFALRARAMIWPDHFAKRVYPLVRQHTLLRYETLRSLYEAALYVVKQGIKGSAVECGVAKGGSGATIATALSEADPGRQVFLFDTFQGLPAPSRENPDYERAVQLIGKCRGELNEVDDLLRRLKLRNYRLIEGMFQETLPMADTGNISLLHIDGDWYESTRACLENLWDRVSEGGIVQIDDYGEWQGCKKAVDEFFDRKAIKVRLQYIDPAARKLTKLHKPGTRPVLT